MSNLNYKKDLEICKFKLDEECENQPLLYMQYAEAAAKAKKEFDQAWENVKVTRARLIKEANEQGAKNDSQREAYYRTHEDHIEAKEEKTEAEYYYNILNSAVFAFSQRKTVLEMLVKLWAGEYFSEPVPERVSRRKMEEHTSRKAKSKVRTKRRDKR